MCKFGKEATRYAQEDRYGIKSCRGVHTIDALRNYDEWQQLVKYYSALDSEVAISCDFNKLLEKAHIP
jgi:hypothetical protein